MDKRNKKGVVKRILFVVVGVFITVKCFLLFADDAKGLSLLSIPFFNEEYNHEKAYKPMSLSLDENEDIFFDGEIFNDEAIIKDEEESKIVPEISENIITKGIVLDDKGEPEYDLNEQVLDVFQIDDTYKSWYEDDITNTENVEYQVDNFSGTVEKSDFPNLDILQDLDFLRNLENMRKNFYIVESGTRMTEDVFRVDDFLSYDLKIGNDEGPKVLIFHTHSKERFSDSDQNNADEGIIGIGKKLSETLYNKYGINVMHVTERYDTPSREGAYERMEPEIERIIAENPSIEVALDLHVDGFNDPNMKLIMDIDGKPTSKIMFVNGLCKVVDGNGTLKEYYLQNPYLKENLAFSFQAQLKANELYPGFTRKIYLKPYRYSVHMAAKSMLIEWGANTNTKEEAFNAVEPVAKVLADLLLDQTD